MATEILRPNAPGDSCTFTTQSGCSACPYHYRCVYEESQDGDTTTAATIAVSKDLYNIGNPTGSGTISHITIYCWARSYSSVYSHGAQYGLKSGTTEAWISLPDPVSGTFTEYSNQWTTDPNTGAAWTWEAIAALQIGVNVYSAASYNGMRCTQIYVVVDYTPVIELAGVSAGVASVSGTIARTLVMAGATAGVAGVSGAIARTLVLKGVSAGVCSASAALTNIKWLAGIITGACSTVAVLTNLKWLAGVVAGKAVVSATLINIKWLAGVIAGVATVSANLFHVRVAIRVLSAVRNLLALRNIPPVR